MEISEKISYLKGLIDGLGIDEDSNEGRVFAAIIDVLDEVAASFEDVADDIDAVDSRVDEIDEDLGNLEEEFYGECDECDDCDGYYLEAECPACGAVLALPDDTETDDEIVCPECGEHFEVELDEECDCCCGDEHDHEEE